MLILRFSFIRRRLRRPLYGLLVLSLVCGMVLSANSQAFMAWQMGQMNSVASTDTAMDDIQHSSVADKHAMADRPSCHDMMNTDSGQPQDSSALQDCDASCPCCSGACSSFAITLDMPRAIRSKQQNFSSYTPRPAAAVVLALPQRPPIFS